MLRFAILFLLAVHTAFPVDFKVGIGRIPITPASPIWLSGYASRNHPSEGIVDELWAKALAIDDGKGGRVVIVTTDLIGLPRPVADEIAARCIKQYDLERSQLLLNSSHTHTGPVVAPGLLGMWDLKPDDLAILHDYSRELVDKLIKVVGAALADLAPASLSYGTGSAAFAVNRREFTPHGVRIGVNPDGPTDHAVPVLRVTRPDGTLRAVLFGYACHNTTLNGDFYRISGDYAGFAQSELERLHPGTTALFLMLCGGDQNPNPRGTLDLAQAHGTELANEVDRVLRSSLQKLNGPLRTAFQVSELALAPYTRDDFEPLPAGVPPARRRLAESVLRAIDERRAPHSVPYPVQAIGFGKKLALIALGGEPVVGYDLRIRKEFPAAVVAGYSNDVMGYIPTAPMLKEGGYEPLESTMYYGQPAPFTPEVEETVLASVRSVMKRIGLNSDRGTR